MTAPRVPRHNVHLLLADDEWQAYQAHARRLGVPVTTAIRLMGARGLSREAADPTPAVDRRPKDAERDARALDGVRDAALAALLASEHALAVINDKMSLNGQEKADMYRQMASVNANRRLTEVGSMFLPPSGMPEL